MGNINKPNIVARQYATAQHLDSRISIHEKYNVDKQGWFSWLFPNMPFRRMMMFWNWAAGTADSGA